MRKKILVVAAAALAGMLVLTACSSGGDTGAGAGTTSGANGSGTAGNTGTDPQNVNGTQVSQGSPAEGSGTDASAAGEQGGNTSGEVQQGGNSSGEVQQGADASGADGQEDQGDVLSDVPAVGDLEDGSTPSEDGWSGTYVGDGETVTVTKLDDGAISFSFAQSGISGTAAISNGYQAVYNGDDHHVVVFNINGTVLDVSVSSEEDYDASASPLNGTYVKEA